MADDADLAAQGVLGDRREERRGRRWRRRIALAAAGVIIFLLGVAAGGGDPQVTAADPRPSAEQEGDPARSAELAEAQRRVTEREAKVDTAAADIAARAEAVADAERRLDVRSARLDARAAKLDERKSRLDDLASDLEARESRLDERAEALEGGSDPDDAAPFVDPGTSPYYDNCSEARAAGAAPLSAGDPGYAGHLDGDGDGIACE